MQIKAHVKRLDLWEGKVWAALKLESDYSQFPTWIPGDGLVLGQQLIIEIKETEQ